MLSVVANLLFCLFMYSDVIQQIHHERFSESISARTHR